MEEQNAPEGEFHHFQLVDPTDGTVPMSISVLVHYNNQRSSREQTSAEPITLDEVVTFHDALQGFDGNYSAAFSKK
jgi:hypothetical protein